MLRNRALYSSDLHTKPVLLHPRNAILKSITASPANVLLASTDANLVPVQTNHIQVSRNMSPVPLIAGQPTSQSTVDHLLLKPIYWSKEIVIDAVSTLSQRELDDLAELEIFAKHFREKRIVLGLSQGDAGTMLATLYGAEFSQATVSRFESLNLPCKKMSKLKPYLKNWLDNELEDMRVDKKKLSSQARIDRLKSRITSAAGAVDFPLKQRKKRTALNFDQKEYLDEYFRLVTPYPRHEELQIIAQAIQVEHEVARIWFCNRRAKERQESIKNSHGCSAPARHLDGP